MRNTRFSLFLVTITLVAAACNAKPAAPGADTDADAAIRAGMAKLLPAGVQVDAIKPGPIEGLREITVDGRVAYVTADGKHFVQGPIIELDSRRNLTQVSEAALHKIALDAVGEDRRIVFPATVPERFKITVFTDVECGYCREFHKHIADYNKAGITVEYLMYPRGGVGTTAARTMQNVWCAADRRKALTDAKNDRPVPAKACKTYIAEDYALGQRIGLNGTPAIYAANGMQVGGYLPPEQIVAALEAAAGQTK